MEGKNEPEGFNAVVFGLAVGLIFFLVGMGFFLAPLVMYGNCTEAVDAVVLDFEQERVTDDNNRAYYLPVFSFEYNGREYEIHSDSGTHRPEYSVGQTVKIHIDPDNPNEYYVPLSKKRIILAGGFVGIGGICSIAMIGMMIANKKNKE